VDAETGVFTLLYLEPAYEQRKRAGQMRSRADLRAALEDGAVKRLRPKVMTVASHVPRVASNCVVAWGWLRRDAPDGCTDDREIFTSSLLELLGW